MSELGFEIRDCEHGGVWLTRFGGEAMQVTGENLKQLKLFLEAFWALKF